MVSLSFLAHDKNEGDVGLWPQRTCRSPLKCSLFWRSSLQVEAVYSLSPTACRNERKTLGVGERPEYACPDRRRSY